MVNIIIAIVAGTGIAAIFLIALVVSKERFGWGWLALCVPGALIFLGMTKSEDIGWAALPSSLFAVGALATIVMRLLPARARG